MAVRLWHLAGACLLASAPVLALNPGAATTSAPGGTGQSDTANQPSRASLLSAAMVNAYLDGFARDDEMLSAVVSRQFGANLSPEKRQFAMAQQRRVFASPGLKRFSTRIVTAQIAQGATKEELLEAMGVAAISRTGKGLARLPLVKRRAFTEYLQQMYQGLPGEQCNLLMDPKTSAVMLRQVEGLWIGGLPQARFEQAVSLYTEATLAQLDAPETPAPVKPNEVKQTEQATARFEAALLRQAQRQFSPEALARIESAQGQARETCEFGALMTQTLQQMPDADFLRASAALFEDL